jgi:hypothetical protein
MINRVLCRARTLAQHGAPSAQAELRVLDVPARGRCDIDNVDGVVGGQFLVCAVAHRNIVRRAELFGALGAAAAHGAHAAPWARFEHCGKVVRPVYHEGSCQWLRHRAIVLRRAAVHGARAQNSPYNVAFTVREGSHHADEPAAGNAHSPARSPIKSRRKFLCLEAKSMGACALRFNFGGGSSTNPSTNLSV